MRNLLLASAAVIATMGMVSGQAQADYWATLNVNYGYIDGDLDLRDFSASYKSTLGTANIGALTVNDNEENVTVKVMGPVVDIDIHQSANNRNSQGADVTIDDMENKTGGQIALAGAAAGFAGFAAAGALAGNLGIVDQENEVKVYDNDRNRQFAGNLAIVHVEDPFGGLLDCGCSADDFYTANINYGDVSGDIHAHDFSLTRSSSLTAANIGAATINKSVNNMDVTVRNRGHRY
ncbi:MAG: hypothetical protein ACTSX7_08895 [Alphaproteobacteria bacterium]